MAKLILFSPPQRLHSLNHAALAAVHLAASSPSSAYLRFRTPLPPPPPFPLFLRSSPLTFSRSSDHRRVPSARAFSSSSSSTDEEKGRTEEAGPGSSSGSSSPSEGVDGDAGGGDGSVLVDIEKGNGGAAGGKEFPSGELEIVEFDWWKRFVVQLRMLFALPWERVRKGSVLSIKLKGKIADQLKSSFSSGLSLPQICENFTKAAYDPRVSAIYLQIEPLSCGWGKIEEIRRHILYFKKSGKLIVSYVPICGEKEYYLACACEELYLPPSAYVGLFGFTVQASFLRGDIVLIDESVDGLNAKLERWRHVLESKYFRIRSELELMHYNFSNERVAQEVMVLIDGQNIPKSSSFRYLGSIIQKRVEIFDDVVYRIKIGWLK